MSRLTVIRGIVVFSDSLVAGLSVGVLGQEPREAEVQLSPKEVAFFENNIRPILTDKCYDCHSSKLSKPEGSLLLDSRAGLLRGGAHGPAIVPGKPDESLLVQAVRRSNKDFQMPPQDREPLTRREIDALVDWVKMGAPDPRTETSAPSAAAAGSLDWGKRSTALSVSARPGPPAA